MITVPCLILTGLHLAFCAVAPATAATSAAAAQPAPSPDTPPDTHRKSAETLAGVARPAVVVISQFGRNGEVESLGSGFVISSNGLIATSLHVIGEARPIKIEFASGATADVTEIRAWDRKLDLAVLQVNAKNLPALPLGDSDSLHQGREVIAMGHPRGFEHSIVQGVISAIRDFENSPMIQLAMPIEPGNSGGPLLDMDGNVQGILTMKSVLSDNLGFAMPVNALKLLLNKPNPVPIQRWLTLGSLDSRQWTPTLGARWTQRAGRIQVDGAGNGFGGRSLCISELPVPGPPYEIQVSVRLDDESGAAGIAFAADGGDKHYGFYPTGGQLRLTQFDGPTVFSWNILEQVTSPEYRPGDWNTLKVRVETNRVLCYVNGTLALQSPVMPKFKGKAGLAKFRQTKATFKGFVIAKNIPAQFSSPDDLHEIQEKIDSLASGDFPDQTWIESLEPKAALSHNLLLERAKKLEEKSNHLRKLAADVQAKHVQDQLLKTLAAPDDKIDLFQAALLIAKIDNAELDVAAYCQEIDRMAADLSSKIPAGASDDKKLALLNEFLFVDNGFHGSRSDFYNPANSYLNQVLDDREGIPITLSILYLELGKKIGLDHLAGLSLPYRFVVQYQPAHGPAQIIDVFDGGKHIGESDLDDWSRAHAGAALPLLAAKPATKKEIILRMLRNLIEIQMDSSEPAKALPYLDASIAIDPEDPLNHLRRGSVRYKSGDLPGAKEDFRWVLQKRPPNLDLDRLEQLFRSL